MEFKVYYTESASNEIGKILEDEQIFRIRIKKTTDQLNPIIPIKSDIDLMGMNYAYFEGFNRYYFIDEIEPKPNNIYTLHLRVDVLETWKNDILNGYGNVTRGTNENPYFDNGKRFEVRTETDKHFSNVEIPDVENIILNTIGG